MFKVNSKDTRTTPLASFWCLYCYLLTYTPCSLVYIVNFEQINADWHAIYCIFLSTILHILLIDIDILIALLRPFLLLYILLYCHLILNYEDSFNLFTDFRFILLIGRNFFNWIGIVRTEHAERLTILLLKYQSAWIYRSSHRRCSVKNGVLQNFANFTGKQLCRCLCNKVAGPQPCIFIKKRFQHRCFPVKFAKFSRTPFLTGWPLVLEFLELFLNFFGSRTVLEKQHILAVVLEMFLKSHFCLRCSQGL